MALKAGRRGIFPFFRKQEGQTKQAGVDEQGRIWYKEGSDYTLPVANADTLGGVKPVAKTESMLQDVGVDSNGKLYTAIGSTGGLDLLYTNPLSTNPTSYDPKIELLHPFTDYRFIMITFKSATGTYINENISPLFMSTLPDRLAAAVSTYYSIISQRVFFQRVSGYNYEGTTKLNLEYNCFSLNDQGLSPISGNFVIDKIYGGK